jgi:membrane protein implicated in regulation of membrane protease activity
MVWIWLAAAIIFIIIEAVTVGLTTIWFAAGALVALILALIKVGVGVQVAVFLILSLVLLATTRKIFVNKLKTGSEKTNVDALVGEEAVVLEDITPFNTGLVKVKGQNWTAIAADKDASILKGSTVKIKAIEGVKLIVE